MSGYGRSLFTTYMGGIVPCNPCIAASQCALHAARLELTYLLGVKLDKSSSAALLACATALHKVC